MQVYERFIELKNLKESLTTENYRHYYIHMEDSLDKLIGRTEANYQFKDETQGEVSEAQLDENEATQSSTTNEVDIKQALELVEPVPLFDRTKKIFKIH